MSPVIKKTTTKFAYAKTKGADQLCSYCTADQPFCLHYMDSIIPVHLKSEILSLLPSSVTVQCQTWPKTRKTSFFGCGSYVGGIAGYPHSSSWCSQKHLPCNLSIETFSHNFKLMTLLMMHGFSNDTYRPTCTGKIKKINMLAKHLFMLAFFLII